MDLVIRSADNARIFPCLGWGRSDAERAAGEQRLAGLAGGRTGAMRAVRLQAEALAAEQAGRFELADFLYRDIDADLAKLASGSDWLAVRAVADDAAAVAAMEPAALRDVALAELFIDGHIALANAAAKAEGAQTSTARREVQLERADALRQMLSDAKALPPGPFELSLANARVQSLEASGAWDRAAGLVEAMLPRLADAHAGVRKLADVRIGAFARDLKLAATDAGRIRASATASRLLLADIERHPGEPALFEVLGLAYRQLAIARANSGEYADALVDIERASDAHPWQDGLDEVRKQLHDAMAALKTKMTAVEREMAGSRATLTAEGKALQRQAQAGIGPVSRYLDGAECKGLRAKRRAATAASVWRRLKIGPVPSQPARTLALLDAIEAVAAATAGREATAEDVAAAIAGKSDLDQVPREVVARFVHEPGSFPPDVADAFASGPAENALIASAAPPRLASGYGVPSGMWWRSRQSRGWRMAAAASLVAVVGSASAFAVDWQRREVKAGYYREVEDAWARQDEAATKAAIGRFEAAKTLALNDARGARVAELRQRLDELPGVRQRAKAWGEMQAAVTAGNDRAVLDAAETYLQSKPARAADENLKPVLALYAQSLLRWLATAEAGVTDGDVKKRLDAYRQHAKSPLTRS